MSTPAVSRRPRAGPPRPRARDIGLAVALCVLDLTLFSSVKASAPPWIYALAVVGFLPLLWRKVAPVPMFFVVLFFALVSALGSSELRPTLALLVASYSVAASRDRRTTLALASLAVPTFVGISTLGELRTDGSEYSVVTLLAAGLLAAMLGCAPWVLGRVARASKRKVRDAEVAGKKAAERARVEERRQIALELHDIISHSVTVMVMQADGARAILRVDPAAVEPALDHIASVGRSSIGELRRLLGVLADGTVSLEIVGANGIADLPAVVAEAERNGLRVRLEITGRPQQVPSSFEASVHRIVKEAVANSLKHGGPGTEVLINLFWSDGVLVVTVSDNGDGRPGDPSLSTGHGLAGIRERVRALDGRLDAGPEAGRPGYLVSATLPIPMTVDGGLSQPLVSEN